MQAALSIVRSFASTDGSARERVLHWQQLEGYGADAGPKLKASLSTFRSGSSGQPLCTSTRSSSNSSRS